MASTLPSSTSDYKLCPNEPIITPQQLIMSQSNDNITMLLGQEDSYNYPFFNYSIDNFLSPEYSNTIDTCSPHSNSIVEVPSFGTSCFDNYYNTQFEGRSVDSSGSATYDGLEISHGYSTLLNHVPSANTFAAAAPVCWGFQKHMTQEDCSHNNNIKVRKYSAEERKDRILRYLHKRSRRNFRKTIKYACRKTLADRRVRIRGRFAKNQEEEGFSNYSHPTHHQDSVAALPFHNVAHEKEQCKDITEELLQESIASLLYDPNYIAGLHAELHQS